MKSPEKSNPRVKKTAEKSGKDKKSKLLADMSRILQ
jgi:hypothetical protein